MILILKNIYKTYENVTEGETAWVLEDINLKVESGQSIAIVGPSGSGKSTLLNLIGALDNPTRGSVSLDGTDYGSMNEDALARIRNRELGFVFQLHHLLPQCTALENVLIPALPGYGKADRTGTRERAEALLERVGLARRMDHFPSQLSGGELQRVAVVRALINRPKLLLADEPTGSLDQSASEKLALLLRELNREEGTALVIVTHSRDLAVSMDTVYTLKNGKLAV